jgi:hypothetical protein
MGTVDLVARAQGEARKVVN